MGMGPNRAITNRRGYLTETVFDEETGRFEERPWPPADDSARETDTEDAMFNAERLQAAE
jgi:hypothetical protein